jgi:putative heme-binding domain-containing protein
MRRDNRLPLVLISTLVLGGIAPAQVAVRPPPADAFGAAAEGKNAIRSQQEMVAKLGAAAGPDADRKLLALLERYRAHELPAALWLEVFEAAAKRENPEVKARLAEIRDALEKSRDPVSRFRDCLEGGDAEAGRIIFTQKPEAGCIRCHRVSGEGGEIGPDLTTLRQATDRVFILESIIDPNAVTTSGFQNVLLKMKDGESVSGIISFESADDITITSVTDGKKRKLKIDDIAERTPLPSAMPPGFGLTLGKRAIRDLVEFIATVE